MDIPRMWPWILTIALAVIGVIEYLKTITAAVKTRSVKMAMVLLPLICFVVSFLSVPLIAGSEIEGTIATIHYASGLTLLVLAAAQLFYDNLFRAMTRLIEGIGKGP